MIYFVILSERSESKNPRTNTGSFDFVLCASLRMTLFFCAFPLANWKYSVYNVG